MMILRFLYYMPVCFIDNNLLSTYTRAHLALLWTCRTLRRDALCELQHALDVATYGGSIDGMHIPRQFAVHHVPFGSSKAGSGPP
jgi:hypothetical protein